MLCITHKTQKDGYTLISITDAEGFHSSLGGFDQWPFNQLFAEYGIQL